MSPRYTGSRDHANDHADDGRGHARLYGQADKRDACGSYRHTQPELAAPPRQAVSQRREETDRSQG
jgi:hypothetical protein